VPLGRTIALLVVLALAGGARRSEAQGGYEIQVYGADLVERGRTMLELHSNFTPDGVTVPAGGLASSRHALHETVEITHGFTGWFEVGFYLFTSLRPGAGLEWVGDHVRPRVRAPASWGWPVGASLSVELGPERRRYFGDTWSLEVRPIVDRRMGRWYWSVNPALERALGGDRAAAWEFAPGATVTLDVSRTLTVGVEYYGSYGPLRGFDPPDERWQQVFPVLWLHVSPEWEINAGAGLGLTHVTDYLTAKLIIGRRL
jgi:hypothetical protein